MERNKFEKIECLETLGELDLGSLDGPIDELIQTLENYKILASQKGWTKVHINVDWNYDNVDIYVRAWRWETDKEFDRRWEMRKAYLNAKAARQKKRAEAAAKKLQKTEEEQRALYEELKRKFG